MSEEQLKELQEYNLEYLEAQASEEMFGGDFTSAVELKQANKEIERLNNIIEEVREIFKDYGDKEDIVGYTMYNITGEQLINILDIVNKALGSDKK